ncbi:MAG: hypothetical protein RIC55_32515 [Pirellulaceae bacterium]
MRNSLMAILLACALPGALGAQSLPYTASVVAEEAQVRSGPGDAYYATDMLRRGAEVEVYRIDDGEWLGIRPPEGSFSWAPASALELSSDSGVARVVQDGTMAWIGARVGRVPQHKWQVKLSAGERVRVISDKRHLASLADQDESWYKIAPPAGEFRWIHQRDVQRTSPPPRAVAVTAGQNAPEESDVVDANDSVRPGTRAPAASADDLHLTDLDVRPTDHQVPVAGDRSQSAANSTAEATAARRETPSDGFVARDKTDDASQEGGAPAANVARSNVAATPWDDDLRMLHLELSSAVAQPMASWNLNPLREKTERLIEAGDTALERGRARLLLDKISQFEDLQHGKTTSVATTVRNLELSTGETLFVPPSQTSAAADVANATPSPQSPGDALTQPAASLEQLAADGRYDGVGWLLPVHSQNQIAPRFALTDDRGHVIQYIVPAPGRNLHRHLRKQVGIIGQRQSVTGLAAPVLTANNVVELDRHR